MQIPHFLDNLNAEEKEQIYSVFEDWPNLLEYFTHNHVSKEKAVAKNDEGALNEIVKREEKQIERIFRDIVPLMNK
jgi:hypothetical protein